MDVHDAIVGGMVGVASVEGLLCADCRYLEKEERHYETFYKCSLLTVEVHRLVDTVLEGNVPRCDAGMVRVKEKLEGYATAVNSAVARLSERDVGGMKALGG